MDGVNGFYASDPYGYYNLAPYCFASAYYGACSGCLDAGCWKLWRNFWMYPGIDMSNVCFL